MSERRAKALLLLATVLVVVTFTQALAAEPVSPGAEVKFFLKPQTVLEANGQLNDALRTAFEVVREPVTIRMQFLDGPQLELHEEGWNVRFRKLEDKDDMELTFKRRYPVDGSLDATLAQAAQEGFDAAESDYEPELEVGFQKQTLTFSNDQPPGNTKTQSLHLPSSRAAQKLATQEMPDKLRRWKEKGWAERVLSGARLYGPVEGRRWRGRHDDVDNKITIEVWALPTANGTGMRNIVEISFKEQAYDADAKAKRKRLLQLLDKKGWLLEEDVLKTELILKGGGRPDR